MCAGNHLDPWMTPPMRDKRHQLSHQVSTSLIKSQLFKLNIKLYNTVSNCQNLSEIVITSNKAVNKHTLERSKAKST